MHISQATRAAANRGVVVMAVAALFIGCAAAESASPLRGPDEGTHTIVLTTPSGTAEASIRRDQHVAIADLPASRTDVWPLVLEAWKDSGLPDPVVDDRGYRVAVTNTTVQRRIGRRPISSYLSCGSSISGPNADSHRIRLTAQALVERAGDARSVLHIRIEATAHTTEGASAAPIPCATLGTLENLIVTRVIELLQTPASRADHTGSGSRSGAATSTFQ